MRFCQRLILAFLVLCGACALSRAQNAGVVGINTRLVNAFTNQAATGASSIFPDFGFGCNVLNFQTTNFIGTIVAEWSPLYNASTNPNATFYTLTEATFPSTAPDSANHQLQIGPYYPNMRAHISAYTSGTISAWYSGQATSCPVVTSGLGSNGPTSPVVCDRTALVSLASGTTGAIAGPINSGDTVVLCAFTLSFAATPTTGTVLIDWATTSGCTTLTGATWETYTTGSTPQIIPYIGVPQRSVFTASYPYACLNNSSGQNLIASFSYASVHGL